MTFLEEMLGPGKAREVKLHQKKMLTGSLQPKDPEKWTITFSGLEKGKKGSWDIMFNIQRYYKGKVTKVRGIAVLGEEVDLAESLQK